MIEVCFGTVIIGGICLIACNAGNNSKSNKNKRIEGRRRYVTECEEKFQNLRFTKDGLRDVNNVNKDLR